MNYASARLRHLLLQVVPRGLVTSCDRLLHTREAANRSIVSRNTRSRRLPCVAIPVRICDGQYTVKVLSDIHVPCTNAASTLLPVWSSGCPTTICRNRCSPSLLCSITSSEKRFVSTLPGRGGIVTRALSRSSISLKASNSLYRRLTVEDFNLNAGILVRITISYVVYMPRPTPCVMGLRTCTHRG